MGHDRTQPVDLHGAEGHKAECAERDANAALIAAAPDMLAALKIAREQLRVHANADYPSGDDIEAEDAINAAIQKAEGK